MDWQRSKWCASGKGPTWLFDLDYLTDSMSYQPVRSENQANKHAAPKEANQNAGSEDNIDAGDSAIEVESAQDYFVLPIWSSYISTVKSSKANNASEEPTKHPDLKPVDKEDQVFLEELERLKRQEQDANDAAEALRKEFAQETEDLLLQAGAAKASSTNIVNTASTPVSTASPYGGLSFTDLINTDQDDSEIPALEEIYDNPTDGIFTNSSYDDEGAVADFTNLEPVVSVSPIPTSRINSIHPSTLILGDPQSAVQTRSKVTKSSGAHAFVSYIQKQRRNNHKDFQHCLFACFLSQNEPKKISEALEDESWVDAMQEELLQFKIQKVWILVDLPYGKKAIGTKWVYRNKKDERGVVVKIRQGSCTGPGKEGKDYEEEVYVSQPPSFIDPKYPKKNGYRRGTIDKTLFIKKDKHDIILVQVYVDDIFFGSTKKSWCDEFKALMKSRFQNEFYGRAQPSFLDTSQTERRCCACSKVLGHFKTSHLSVVKRIFRYLKGKPKLGLWYPRVSSFDLEEPISDMTTQEANLDRKVHTGGSSSYLFYTTLEMINPYAALDLKGRQYDLLETLEGDIEGTEELLLPEFRGRGKKAPERPSKPQPTPSPYHLSEVHVEPQSDQSPRPSPTSHIPDSIPESSGRSQSSSDKSLSGNEAQIKKLKKKAKPVITHHRAWMKSVSMKQRLEGKKSLKTQWMQKESNALSTDKQKVSTDKEKDSTDKEKDSTDRPDEGTIDQTEGRSATPTTTTTTPIIFRDDETIAQVLINMSQAKAVSREKKKGVELKEISKKVFSKQRVAAIRNRPPTRTQLRSQMMTYLKHVRNKKHSDLKNKTFEEIQVLYEKVKRFDESFTAVGSTEDERKIKEMNEEAKGLEQKRLKKRVVKETSKKDDTSKIPAKIDATELGTKKKKGGHMKMLARKRKRPQPDVDSHDEHRKCLNIVTFEGTIDSEIMEKKSFISKLDKVSSPEGDYLVIYRANGNFRAFNYLFEVLHIFDRQDLFHLYNLMIEQYLEITLEGFELILWEDLKIMMESSTDENDQSDFWSDQHMLVERRYPLSKDLLQRMLDLGLEVERESTAALDLIRFIKQQIDEE
ncbi:hypothetical protein Tco_1145475 [Tanacetum coccineum]